MLLPADAHRGAAITRRSERRSENGSRITTVTAIVVAVAIAFSIAFLTYLALKSIRVRCENPKYVPTQYLKEKWRRWQPVGLTGSKGNYSSRLQQDTSYAPALHRRGENGSARESAQLGNLERNGANADGNEGAVERNTSVRSVMTLPAYSKSVRDNERVLAREGERGGVDTVVEAPETVEEEEERREEEMESLYQIRVQRRREATEREERRQARREARERQDYTALAAMRQESIWRAEQRRAGLDTSAALIADHRANSQDRRVSSVSYADLGVARHDGTRLRANSNDSDNRPLLDSAASMSESTVRPTTGDSLSVHQRGRSSTSALSIMSGSDVSDNEVDLPPFGRSGDDFEAVNMSRTQSHSPSRLPGGNRSRTSSAAGPPLSVDTADLGEARIPLYQPPAYDEGFEEAPPYTSPIDRRIPGLQRPHAESPRPLSASGAPMLPEIGRLPSIRIAAATPVEPRRPADFPSTVQESSNQEREG
ncbi:hypothetical protein Q7P37_007073 [Cladosporium fusiforme]